MCLRIYMFLFMTNAMMELFFLKRVLAEMYALQWTIHYLNLIIVLNSFPVFIIKGLCTQSLGTKKT